MIIGDRLRALREDEQLSRGDIEKRTGLLRCYISAWRMVTPFPPSKRWRKWLAL
jgi:transcriptional regulator with XRE-family HTH domain